MSPRSSFREISRRRFLGGTAASAAGFTILPRHVLGGPGQSAAPSDSVNCVLVGCGGRGSAGLGCVGAHKIIAWCDVDTKHLGGKRGKGQAPAAADVDNKAYFNDFRRVMEMKELDVVAIATPPHWHALISIAAAQAGKHVFCEKPMTRFIAEGRPVVEAVKRYGVAFQIGTFGRFGVSTSKDNIINHKIFKYGLLKNAADYTAHIGHAYRKGNPALQAQPVPENLNYDLWLGPAPFKPYHPDRVHYKHRFYWDYEGGDVTNMVAHGMDPLQWIFAKDDTGPVEVAPTAPESWPQHPEAVGPTGMIELTYADGFKIVYSSDGKGKGFGAKSKATEKDLDDAGRKRLAELPDPPPLVKFADAVRNRVQAGGNAEAAHRAVSVLHLVNIALRVGRKFRFDPVAERAVGDDEINRFIEPPMRAPWHL
jgi:myo-inositol 2-dehydrogenase/D-chiro-inositol 1-dehydrogenase